MEKRGDDMCRQEWGWRRRLCFDGLEGWRSVKLGKMDDLLSNEVGAGHC